MKLYVNNHRDTEARGKWGLTPLATTTVLEAMTPVSTEGQTPFSCGPVSLWLLTYS